MNQTIVHHPIFRRLNVKRTFLGLLSTGLSLLVMYAVMSVDFVVTLQSQDGGRWVFEPWDGDGWWWFAIAGVAIAFTALRGGTHYEDAEDVISLFREGERFPEWLNNPTEIQHMITELSSAMNLQIEHVYILDKAIPNAFASFVLARGNIVILHRNLLEILDRESLRSVLAHELAHVLGQDVQHRLFNVLPRLLMNWMLVLKGVQLVGILLLADTVWAVLERGWQLIVFGVIASIIIQVVVFFENLYSQVKESLADIYGASYASVEGSINAFLRLNSRSHTLDAFQKVLRQYGASLDDLTIRKSLHLLPRGAMDGDEIKRLAPRLYAQTKVTGLIDGLSLDASEEIQEVLIQDILDQIFEHPTVENSDAIEIEIPFAWKQFDWNHDGVLQGPEIMDMIQNLRKNETALTSDEGGGSHPSTRDRILLLSEIFHEQLTVQDA